MNGSSKVLVSLCICADSPDLLMLKHLIRTKISCACSEIERSVGYSDVMKTKMNNFGKGLLTEHGSF